MDGGNYGAAGSFHDLLRAAQSGEVWAFDRLYREYAPRLRRFFRSRGCGEDADDLTMEVWAALLRDGGGLASFRGDEEAFVGWLMTVARRRLLDHQRRWWRRPQAARAGEGFERGRVGGGDPAEVVGARMGTEEALALLGEELTSRQLEAVTLHVVGGYKLVEVARRMGTSPNAVAVLYHRALKRLAQRLSSEAGIDDS